MHLEFRSLSESTLLRSIKVALGTLWVLWLLQTILMETVIIFLLFINHLQFLSIEYLLTLLVNDWIEQIGRVHILFHSSLIFLCLEFEGLLVPITFSLDTQRFNFDWTCIEFSIESTLNFLLWENLLPKLSLIILNNSTVAGLLLSIFLTRWLPSREIPYYFRLLLAPTLEHIKCRRSCDIRLIYYEISSLLQHHALLCMRCNSFFRTIAPLSLFMISFVFLIVFFLRRLLTGRLNQRRKISLAKRRLHLSPLFLIAAEVQLIHIIAIVLYLPLSRATNQVEWVVSLVAAGAELPDDFLASSHDIEASMSYIKIINFVLTCYKNPGGSGPWRWSWRVWPPGCRRSRSELGRR